MIQVVVVGHRGRGLVVGRVGNVAPQPRTITPSRSKRVVDILQQKFFDGLAGFNEAFRDRLAQALGELLLGFREPQCFDLVCEERVDVGLAGEWEVVHRHRVGGVRDDGLLRGAGPGLLERHERVPLGEI